ncbi:MAG: MFS transporter [Chloroflexi bacterium]|nr:MFS transporter [Chloroflexota bacterium]
MTSPELTLKTQPWTRTLFGKLLPFGRGNVTKLALAYFFSTLYFYIPVSTLYLRGRGLSYVQINSLWGIIVGTMFLTEIPTGMLADRLGRKRSINVALALQVLGEVIFIFADSYWPFALASVIGGLGFAFSSGCIEALVYDSLKSRGREGDMSKAMGFIGAAERLANLLAYTVGGLLVINLTQERFVMAIIVTACAVAVGCLVSLTLREPPVEFRARDDDSSLKLLADGIGALKNNKQFRGLVLLALATVPFRNYLGLYQPRFVEVGVPPIWLGLTQALGAGFCVLGARYAYRLEERLGSRLSLLLVTGLPGILYLLMAVVAHPAFTVVVFCALYGSMSLKGPIFSGHLNRHIESKNRATVLSLISMFSGLYVALMGLMIGRIGDLAVTYAFMFMGTVVLAGSLLFRVRNTD